MQRYPKFTIMRFCLFLCLSHRQYICMFGNTLIFTHNSPQLSITNTLTCFRIDSILHHVIKASLSSTCAGCIGILCSMPRLTSPPVAVTNYKLYSDGRCPAEWSSERKCWTEGAQTNTYNLRIQWRKIENDTFNNRNMNVTLFLHFSLLLF